MLISSEVTVDGAAVRFAGWQYGYGAGSPIADWSVDPLEAATNFMASTETALHPVTIKASIDSTEFQLIDQGWIDSVEEGISAEGRTNRIQGRDRSYLLVERGPRRDVVFVPRNIIEEVYPRGIRVFTLAGENVIGLPPGTEPRFSGGSFSETINVVRKPSADGTTTIDPKFGSGRRTGPILASPTYDTITEEEFVANPDSEACTGEDDQRRGVIDEWVESVPPVIVLFGAKGLGNDDGKTFDGLTGSGSGNDQAGSGKIGKLRGGGVNGASVNLLISIIARKAGFARVVMNTPDLGMFEPLTVSAGSTWLSAIQTLVGPWNPMIFVTREPKVGFPGQFEDVLNIFDIEAADITNPKITIGPESASVIRKTISRIPPYRSVDIMGTLRRALRKRVSTPPVTTVDQGEVTPDVPHVGPYTELPYNYELNRTYKPSDFGVPSFPGEDAVDWTRIQVRKLLFVDPESEQVSIVESETEVHDSGGIYWRHTMKLDQHLFDDLAHGSIEEEYGRVTFPGAGSSFQLIRRVTNRYDDQTEVEGTFSQRSLIEGLVAFSRQNDQNYKAVPYWDAAASGTIDQSASSIDSVQFAKIQERWEEHQMLDSHVAQKRTLEVDFLGDRKPRFHDEYFGVRHRYYGGGYDPRQRFCFPINATDGEGTKSIAALFAANKKQAELIRDRAIRRGGQRHEELVVELNTFLPRLRPAIAVRLEATPIRVLDSTNLTMTAVNVISGDYWIAGFTYRMGELGNGAARIGTVLFLRSKW